MGDVCHLDAPANGLYREIMHDGDRPAEIKYATDVTPMRRVDCIGEDISSRARHAISHIFLQARSSSLIALIRVTPASKLSSSLIRWTDIAAAM